MRKHLKKYWPVIVGIGLALCIASTQVWSGAVFLTPRLTDRRSVLTQIPHNSGVLINIHRSLFPATWDITLLGQRATKALERGLLDNTQESVRFQCAQVLTQLRDASSRETLHRALSDWNAIVRGQVLIALSKFGDHSSVPHILKRLEDAQETASNHVNALRTLGKLGDARASQAIIAAYDKAKSPQENMIRLAAVNALWDLRQVVDNETLKPFLRKALSDQNVQVIRRAAIALGELRDTKALDAIGKFLQHNNEMLQNVSAYVLGQIGDKRAIPILVQTLPSVRSGRLLNNISFALQRLNDPQLLERLTGFLRHRQAFIRMNAAFTLGDMKLPEARQMLEQATLDPNLIVRNQAIIALAKLGDKKAVPALQQAIKQNTGEQRWLAMLALLYITEGEYREPFVSAVLTSDDHQLRLQSALALASFGEQRVMPYLFYMMRSSTYSRIWNAAKQLKTPMLHQLTLSWLRANINMPVYIQPALDFLGREEANNLKSDLLTLLFTRWYRPDFRPRNISNTVDILDYKGEPIKPWGDYLYVNALQHVIKFLGYSGDAELKPWLKYFIYHVNYHVRSEAQLALARLKDDKVLGDLIEQLRISSEHHRPYLVSLLSDLPNQQLAPKLMPLLDHKDPYLRLAVSVILVSAGSEQALPILLQAFRSPQASMRSRARFYVMQHQTPELARALNSAAKTEKNPTASELLQRITAAMQPSNPNFLLFNVQRVYMR